MRDVGGEIEHAAVGVVNENNRRLALFYYHKIKSRLAEFQQLFFAQFLFRISKDYDGIVN